MSKPHFRLGWEGGGKVNVTIGMTFLPPPHTVRATVQPPQPWYLAVQLLWELGAGVLWPYRGTVSF